MDIIKRKWQAAALRICVVIALVESSWAADPPIPPPFGPHVHPTPADFVGAHSFASTNRLVGTYYFYWYCTDTKEHIINSENGSDGLTDHPLTLNDFCYRSVTWHKKQLNDMIDAGIDFALPVFWGAPSERDPKASLYWSYAGLSPLVEAREQLLHEGKHPPAIGLFYDTSTLQYNGSHTHVDLTSDYGRQWFYSTIRDFFSAVPPKHWAMIDDKPVCLLYAAAFAKKHDQTFVDFTKAQFKADFGRDLYLAPQDSWNVKADNTCAWGGALGLKNPGIGELGPGYDDTAVYGRTPLIAKRNSGRFYEDNWTKFLRRPSNFLMVETWNEFHEGTDICESKEYGRKYIELTRKYNELYKRGIKPGWPKGVFTGATSVSQIAESNKDGGVQVIPAEDGQFDLTRLGDSMAWVPKTKSGKSVYLYARIDESFKWSSDMNLVIQVECFDAASGSLGLEYDGNDVNAPFRGAYTGAKSAALKGTRRWVTVTFKLNDAHLLGSQNGGADFRLIPVAPGIGFRKIVVSRQ